MRDITRDLIDRILNREGYVSDAQRKAVHASKADEKKKMSVKEAYSIYLDEMSQIEESNLGHLAAKHFQHYSNSNSESGHRNPERASQAAAQTLNRIKSVHGASAAAAVKQHSADADNHDNGTVSSGKKGFHKDFVSKHLGGSGSEAHKAYKSHMNKMGYTKKNLGMQTHHESASHFAEMSQLDENNLGHLAAKHFQNYGKAAAGQILNKIKSVHGDKAAAAVKQHTSDADNHDNGMVSSGKKGFHGDFVKKHLGGSGSEAHKAYKSHMNKMGYNQKNLGMKTHHESVSQPDEVEQVNELKKNTVKSYLSKAIKSRNVNKAHGMDHLDRSQSAASFGDTKMSDSEFDKGNKRFAKADKRQSGIDRAKRRYNEEVEQVDELDTSTLKSYSKKAGREADKHAVAGDKYNPGEAGKKYHDKKMAKRQRGQDRADQKVFDRENPVHEDVKQVVELDTSTLKSYIKKANKKALKARNSYSMAASRRSDFADDTPAMKKNANLAKKREDGSDLASKKLAKKNEALTPAQDKHLDVHDDGKIDSKDFKKLRNMRKK
jgi:hypothetical protein